MKLLILGVIALFAIANCQQDVTINEFKLGVLEKGAVAEGLKSVVLFSKFAEVLKVSTYQRLYISFSVTPKGATSKIKPHQVFVILHHNTGADIIFVADTQKDGSYVCDIDLSKVVTEFDGLSGLYDTRLVVGDPNIVNPIDWVFSSVEITVPAVIAAPAKRSELVISTLLPEIQHQFRVPEKRPPGVVSDAFTLLCFSPLVLLFLLWLKVGINFSNMPVSFWTPLFHVGLAAVFGLYFVFWLQLDMFVTLKYLSLVGALTFFAGNRLLRVLANKRKEKMA